MQLTARSPLPPGEKPMSYRIAGIDVHKKMLAVVVSDVEVEDEYQFERRMFSSNPEQLRSLAAWLVEQEVEEVVMESTAQYWKPVWETLERYWKPIRQNREGAGQKSGSLHLAQAQSNRGRRGRKRDFPDAERLVKRLVARELTLSFVPDAEQRLWRTVTRRKYQLTRDHVRLQNQVESLLEEAHIKLSSLVSDLLGASARRMLKALAEGETNPAALAALADQKLRATPEQLCDALGACTDLKPVYRRLLKMVLEQLQFLEQQIGQLDQEMASLLNQHQDAVERLAEVPELGVDSAQQIISSVRGFRSCGRLLPSQDRFARGANFVQAADACCVRSGFDELRIGCRLLSDGLHRVDKQVALFLGFRFCGLNHQRTGHNERKCGGVGMKAVIDQALGEVHRVHAVLFLTRVAEDDFVHGWQGIRQIVNAFEILADVSGVEDRVLGGLADSRTVGKDVSERADEYAKISCECFYAANGFRAVGVQTQPSGVFFNKHCCGPEGFKDFFH